MLRLPAEFERHSHTYLLWPYRSDNWRSSARYGQKAVADLVNVIARFGQVRIGFAKGLNPITTHLLHPGVTVLPMEYEDIWVRDTGPVTLAEDGIAICDFTEYFEDVTPFRERRNPGQY
ncbi:agmatine deiminase family protein [Bradyrhizobium sp. 14AA]